MTTDIACPKTGMPLRRDLRPLQLSYRGETQTIAMPGWYGGEGTESVHTADDMLISDTALDQLRIRASQKASRDA